LNGVLIELSPDDAENLSVFDDVYELKIEPTVCEDGFAEKILNQIKNFDNLQVLYVDSTSLYEMLSEADLDCEVRMSGYH